MLALTAEQRDLLRHAQEQVIADCEAKIGTFLDGGPERGYYIDTLHRTQALSALLDRIEPGRPCDLSRDDLLRLCGPLGALEYRIILGQSKVNRAACEAVRAALRTVIMTFQTGRHA